MWELAKWEERLNFGNIVAEIVRKVWERRKLSDVITEIYSTAQPLPMKCPSARMIYQLWQPSCRNCRELRREKIWIVATKLPKMGGKKKWLSKSREE